MSEDDIIEGEMSEQAEAGAFNIVTTGMPPGNPKHMSEDEPGIRARETADHGKEEAARRAWARANAKRGLPPEYRNVRGQKGPPPKTAASRKSSSTDFSSFGSAGSIPPKPKQKSKDLHGIAATVQMAHAMLAMRLERADFTISDDEAFMLVKAVDDLLEHYGIKIMGTASPWAALVYAITMIYGTRIGTIVIERMKKPQQSQAA